MNACTINRSQCFFAVRARVCLLRDLGAPLAPDTAWGIIQGLETAPLRMKQHCSNAEKAVAFLQKHKNVERVIYPTLHEGEIAARSKNTKRWKWCISWY